MATGSLRKCEEKTWLDRSGLNPVSVTNKLSDLKNVT